MSANLHHTRKHSKFSASGAERWFACPGSVELSEDLPDKDSVWSLEGTKAHEVLESILTDAIKRRLPPILKSETEMWRHGFAAANFIFNLWRKTQGSEIMVETRIALPFIHPAMFGTFDGAVIDHFGILHVFDYKYGAGHSVSPGSSKKPNLQMVFYGLGLAYKYDWNFKSVRLWIIQPRIKGYDGPVFWELSINELKGYAVQFAEAVRRVEEEPETFAEGSHCHWCKAKAICPLKQEQKHERAKAAFSALPLMKGKL